MSGYAGTTTLAHNTTWLTAHETINGWYRDVKDGTWSEEQCDQLALALTGLQREVFNNAFLPKGCYWVPGQGSIFGPQGAKLPDGPLLEDLMTMANRTVALWFRGPNGLGRFTNPVEQFNDLLYMLLWEADIPVTTIG